MQTFEKLERCEEERGMWDMLIVSLYLTKTKKKQKSWENGEETEEERERGESKRALKLKDDSWRG